MWARVADGSIQEIINTPRIITIGGITHPRTMFSLWTDAERKAIGILPITKASHLDGQYHTENVPSYVVSIQIKLIMKPKKRLPASPINRFLFEKFINRNPKQVEKIIKFSNKGIISFVSKDIKKVIKK